MHDKIKKNYLDHIKWIIDRDIFFPYGEKEIVYRMNYGKKVEKILNKWINKYYSPKLFKDKFDEYQFLDGFLLNWVFEESDRQKYKIVDISSSYWYHYNYDLTKIALNESIKNVIYDHFGQFFDYDIDDKKLSNFVSKFIRQFFDVALRKNDGNRFEALIYLNRKFEDDAYGWFVKFPLEFFIKKEIIKNLRKKSA